VREPARGDADRGETERVLVVETLGATSPGRRRLRRAKPRETDTAEDVTVPVTRLTVIDATEVEDDPAAWLARVKKGDEERDELIRHALGCATRALAAWRVASADGTVADPSAESAIAVRVGYGHGDRLVEGQWEEAIEVPREKRRRTRTDALRPQERVAAFLSGRDTPLACEELLLRARSDLDGDRGREAALQVRVGLEALLAERERLASRGQEADLGLLDDRRSITGEAANEALRGLLSGERLGEVEETLQICERVLRRRAAFGT